MQKSHFSFSHGQNLKVLALKMTMGEADMCFMNIFLIRIKIYNLKIKPIFAFAIIFLGFTR